jgi:hypothetical protein
LSLMLLVVSFLIFGWLWQADSATSGGERRLEKSPSAKASAPENLTGNQ